MYVMIKTRLDVAYAISILSRFETNSNKTHLIATKYVLRYLKEILHMRIIYEENDVLIDYIDIDWVENQETRRFTRDYLFILYESVVSWSSKRQATVALSSCEAEYMTQTQIAKKVIWLRRLINELNLNETIIISTNVSVSINVDNQGAIALNKDLKFHSRTKHIDIQWHFVREQVESKTIDFTYYPIDQIIVNDLIKSLDKIKFNRFFKIIDMTKK